MLRMADWYLVSIIIVEGGQLCATGDASVIDNVIHVGLCLPWFWIP